MTMVDCVWYVMAHAQKTDFLFRRSGRVHLNRRGRQFILLLAAELCASAVVMLDTPCSEVVWRVMATHSIRQFPLHFPSRASPCTITFQLKSDNIPGTVVVQWLRCCATNRKIVGSIPAGVSGFFIDIKSFRSHYGPGVDSTSNRNECQEYFLGVMAAGA